MRCRKDVKGLSADEKRLFVEAILGLKAQDSVLHPGSQSRYDDFVEVHLNAMMAMTMTYPGWAHTDSAFLPWHRELLFRFEQELRAVKPATANVTIPYWDWTRAQASGDLGFPFTHDFIGADGAGQPSDRVPQDPAAIGMVPYPHAFDPMAWTVVVTDGVEPAFLVRHFASTSFPFGINPGQDPRAPRLPENDTVVSDAMGPVVSGTYRQAIAATSYADLRSRSESIHNLVHRWVNGNMMMMTSPNDPVFWLHHAAIDRMWTIWQEKQPGLTAYTNSSGAAGHGPTDTLIFHEPAEPAPWSGTATPNQLIDSHATHGESIWYDSDLPEITVDSGLTLDFGDVPQDLTTYRAVRFKINTYRQVRFRITGAPTGNFGLTPLGTEFLVEPTYGPDPVFGYVWVQFHAIGLPSQSSSVVIEAYLLDEDGYYAATEGGEVLLGTFTVDLSADILPLASNAVELVLDRSGSMGAAAGGTSTRGALLKSAVSAFHVLLRPTDEIGIVSFDDLVETPLPLTTQSTGLGTVLTGTALDPRGSTGIGLGILAGAGELAGASHPNKSLLVLTDGNENVHPYVNELPAGTINGRVYAIGFGLPGQVSDAVLNDITQNTQGDLIITGNLPSEEERFLLTKYFVQMLAGVTNANIILDPQGELGLGSEHRIPFRVAETDASLDAIALCPIPPVLDFELVTPSGKVITPAVAAAEPNVEFKQSPDVSFYRIALPALPADAAGSHAGTWMLVFRLRKADQIRKWLNTREATAGIVVSAIRKGRLPYSGVVHTRSNLECAVTLRQDSLEPGATLHLNARLSEYGVPLRGGVRVWGDLNRPDGSTTVITFSRQEPGRYTAGVATNAAGIYRIRVRAEGQTSGGYPFTREKTLSAGVFSGGSRTPGSPSADGGRETLCELLHCLLSGAVLDKRAIDRLKKAGVDIAALKKCLAGICRETPKEAGVKKPKAATSSGKSARAKEVKESFSEFSKPRMLARPKKEDPAAKRAREEAATAMFFRSPWPTLVGDDGHGGHGGGHDHSGHDHGGHDHGPTDPPPARKTGGPKGQGRK